MPIAHVNGTSLHYEINGAGEPLVLLPGLGLDKTYYRLGEPLLRDSYRTVGVDPRGVGQSDRTLRDFTCELWADDFAALIDALGLGRAHVLGSSLGGCTALMMALAHPEKVRSVIAVGAFSQLDRGIEMNFRLRLRIIEKLGMGEEIADHMALWTLSREFIETDEGAEVMAANKAGVRNNSAEMYMALIRSILHWGRRLPGQEREPLFTERLPAIRVPALIVTGDSDHFIPARHSKLIASRIPGAKYVEIGNAGHIPFKEKPRETVAAVKDFLRSLHP
jgi:pimeloyl-ACP methyl ester carboxylesterase